jgi:hypothetical protein
MHYVKLAVSVRFGCAMSHGIEHPKNTPRRPLDLAWQDCATPRLRFAMALALPRKSFVRHRWPWPGSQGCVMISGAVHGARLAPTHASSFATHLS